MFVYFYRRFISTGDGATAVEYALLAGLIGVALITAVALMGDSVDSVLTEAQTAL